jgi:2'-5' RNA ligase
LSSIELYETIRNDHRKDVERGDLAYDETFGQARRDGPLGYVLQIAAANLLHKYEELISCFRVMEPDQNYYPKSDLHITVFEFVSVRPDFRNYEKNIEIFKEVCSEVLEAVLPFPIRFSGTVFTRTSGILAGYDDDRLVKIREALRSRLASRGIAPLERYQSRSAHLSFMGYRRKMQNHHAFLKLVETTKETEWETVEVTKLELVEHDWYNRVETRRVLREFRLGKSQKT